MNEVFVAQERVIRAMAGKRYWRSNSALDSCRPLFIGLSKIVFRLLFCVTFLNLKQSNECESSHFKSKKRQLKWTFQPQKSTLADFSGPKSKVGSKIAFMKCRKV